MSLYIWGRVDFHNTVSARDDGKCLPLEFPVRVPKLPCNGPITSIAVGEQHCIFIADGQLYGFGSNKFRQLHHLALDVCDAPFHIVLPSSATGKPVQVACGASHSLVLLDDGSVMTAGLNASDQLGHVSLGKDKHSEEKWRPWNRAALSVAADKVIAGGNSSFALCGGAVYSWGNQSFGHLGHGTTGELERMVQGPAEYLTVKYPTKVQWFASQKLRVLDIACGPAHLLARTETDVYAVGDNSYGKLGVPSVQQLLVPQRVQMFASNGIEEKLVAIAAGADQSFAIRTAPNGNAVIYEWGHINKDPCSTPSQIGWGVPADTAAIYGGSDFQLLVRRNGALYSWGTPKALYQVSNGMHSSDPAAPISKRFPSAVTCMEGKFVKTAAIGRTFAVIVCDDSKFAPRPGCIPENSTLHCMVPKGHRYPLGFTPRLTPDRFENAIRQFFKRLYGDVEKYFAEIPQASEAPLVATPTITKRGPRSLRVGSKVRVWMTDVYAWGTILGVDVPEHPKNSFEVKWVREDWDPEVVQLDTDDETLDEENDNRWQHFWVFDQ